MVAHTVREQVPVNQRRPEVPQALTQLVMTCLEKDPAQRCQSCKEIRRQLDELMGFDLHLAPTVTSPDADQLATSLEAGRAAFRPPRLGGRIRAPHRGR
jgi:hypothetical protein